MAYTHTPTPTPTSTNLRCFKVLSHKIFLLGWFSYKWDLRRSCWYCEESVKIICRPIPEYASCPWIHKWHPTLGAWWYCWVEEKKTGRPGTEPCHECPCPWQISEYLCGSQKDFHSLWRVNWQLIWREANSFYSSKNRIKKSSECGTLQFPTSFFFPTWVFLSLNPCSKNSVKKKKKKHAIRKTFISILLKCFSCLKFKVLQVKNARKTIWGIFTGSHKIK